METTTKWSVDLSHSEVGFSVRHLMVSKVTGYFKQFEATVETEGDDLSTAKINFKADMSSVSTNNDQRDAHLRSSDFFHTDEHPELVFVANGMEKIDDENYKMSGTLTMHGVSKTETFNVEFGGIMQDPWGNTRAGFAITGKIHRKDYGISFGLVSETAGIMLSDEVNISANTEFVKQAVLQPA